MPASSRTTIPQRKEEPPLGTGVGSSCASLARLFAWPRRPKYCRCRSRLFFSQVLTEFPSVWFADEVAYSRFPRHQAGKENEQKPCMRTSLLWKHHWITRFVLLGAQLTRTMRFRGVWPTRQRQVNVPFLSGLWLFPLCSRKLSLEWTVPPEAACSVISAHRFLAQSRLYAHCSFDCHPWEL